MSGGARRAAAGFRVRSGRAIAVLLAGPGTAPRLLARGEVALADPRRPETVQPYHADYGTLEKNPRRLASRRDAVRRAAERSVAVALGEWTGLGARVAAATLVVGSTRPPQKIANEHIRAHALEGELFRTVLAAALADRGVACRVVTEREIVAAAATALGASVDELRMRVTALGAAAGRPWRADHKLAAAGAWLQLAARRGAARGR